MLDNLIIEKNEIIKNHEEKLADINAQILKLMSGGMKDKGTKAGGGANVLSKIMASFEFNRNETLNMDSHDRLEYSRMWFENAKSMMETIKNDPGYASVLANIDQQLQLYQKVLQEADKELAQVDDKQKRKELERKKDDTLKRSA